MSKTDKFFYLAGDFHNIDQLALLIPEKANCIYEVLRVINGKPLFLADHFERFTKSLSELSISNPYKSDFVRKIIQILLNKNGTEVCNLRFEVIHKKTELQFAVYEVPSKYPDRELYLKGINVASYSIERNNPHIKQSSVNDRVRKELQDLFLSSGAYEILLIDSEGHITEGSRSNIFFIRDDKLYTPSSEKMLEGITRKKVLEIAVSKGISVIEENISLNNIEKFDACFITGTSPKVLPIALINNSAFNVSNGLLLKLIKEYDKLIEECINY